jgi:hypothetical protein
MRKKLEEQREAGDRFGGNRLQLMLGEFEDELRRVERILAGLERRFADEWLAN